MKVYELIQKLAQYEADAEVKLNVKTDEYECSTVDGEEVVVKFDESFFDIDEVRSERRFGSKPEDVIINITY